MLCVYYRLGLPDLAGISQYEDIQSDLVGISQCEGEQPDRPDLPGIT